MTEQEQPRTDPLFIALTRPAMFFGLPYDFAATLFFVTVFLFIATASFWVFLVGVPLFIAGRALAEKEPRFITLMRTRFFRCPKHANRKWWGGVNSYEP